MRRASRRRSPAHGRRRCRSADARRSGVPGQHVHHRDPGQVPPRRCRAGRRLRGHLAELRPGRGPLRRVRAAVCRTGARRGGEFRANAYTTGGQIHPAVAVGRNGDFVVAWSSEQDGDQGGVVARRFDTSGTPIGGEFLVNQFTTGDQSYPRIARDPRRQFVVAWSSPDLDGSSLGVAARRFDAAGDPLGRELLVNTYTTSVQRWGDVSVAADGSFVTVWEDYTPRDGSGSAIFAQRFDAAGGRAGGEFGSTPTRSDGRRSHRSPSPRPEGSSSRGPVNPAMATDTGSSRGASTPLAPASGPISS